MEHKAGNINLENADYSGPGKASLIIPKAVENLWRVLSKGMEKEIATHSSVLAWRTPGTGEPCGLLSMGSHRVLPKSEETVASENQVSWRLTSLQMTNGDCS